MSEPKLMEAPMMRTRGSFEWRTQQLSAAIRATRGDKDYDWYIEETFDTEAIVRDYKAGTWWKVAYTLDDGTGIVTLGAWAEIEQTWTDVVAKQIRMLVPVSKGVSPAPRRITLGVVLEPDDTLAKPDLQGDVMKAIDIELSAHQWMIDSQAGGEMHATVVKGAKPVESYLAPCDFEVETADGVEKVLKGSWVLAMQWPQEQWEKIEKGEYTGYSVGGQGVRIPLDEGVDGD